MQACGLKLKGFPNGHDLNQSGKIDIQVQSFFSPI